MTAPVSALQASTTTSRPLAALPPGLDGAGHWLKQHIVPVVALIAVVARLPFLAGDPTLDEAGFLLVGQQWHAGGASLYGNYWVDRPPLLITLFQIAAELGGLVPLRLIGCLATVVIVLGSAHVARRLGGNRAATWAAITAAALCDTPLVGGQAINGELLAAPFVVGGLAAVLAAIERPSDRYSDRSSERRAVTAAALAGAAAVASLLVKQNMADVGVFGLVVLLVAWRRGEITAPRLARSILAAAAGGLACLAIVTFWTIAHGTSVAGVYNAMYPFRVEAERVLATSNHIRVHARLRALVGSCVFSGAALVMAVTAEALVSRRLRSTAVWGIVAMVLFDVVSIALGGSYWTHYLIQLVVPVAVLSGVLVASLHPAARPVATATAIAAAIALGVHLTSTHPAPGTSVGEAVHHVAGPHDTIVTTWGHADVTRASGLHSPYPYLWALPVRILDPRLNDLTALLEGPQAPTWFVTWRGPRTWWFHGGGPVAARALSAHYNPVAEVNGHTIYLHRGVDRTAPDLSPHSTNLSASSANRPRRGEAKELP